MRSSLLLMLLGCAVAVKGNHTFLGSSIGRELIHHYETNLHAIPFKKRVKNYYFVIPPPLRSHDKLIRGIIAYDLTRTGAVASVKLGGLDDIYVNLQMKSERGRPLHYDVSIYA